MFDIQTYCLWGSYQAAEAERNEDDYQSPLVRRWETSLRSAFSQKMVQDMIPPATKWKTRLNPTRAKDNDDNDKQSGQHLFLYS